MDSINSLEKTFALFYFPSSRLIFKFKFMCLNVNNGLISITSVVNISLNYEYHFFLFEAFVL